MYFPKEYVQNYVVSTLIFLTIPSKIVPQHKGQTLRFLINKLVNATPQTNSTYRKLRSSAFQQYQGLGVADRVFLVKY